MQLLLIFVYRLVVLLFISSLSTLPLINVSEQQKIDGHINETYSSHLSPLVSNNNIPHLQKENETLSADSNRVSTPMTANANNISTNRVLLSSTSWPRYTSTYHPSGSSLTWWEITLIVLGCLCFCCCCGGGGYRAHTGHWEIQRIWVRD